jgi:hypothetical protein
MARTKADSTALFREILVRSSETKMAGFRPPLLLSMDARVEPGHDDLNLVIQKAPQLPASARMLQLPQRLRLNLTNAFARNTELLADFFQRVVGVHADAEAHAQHAFFARGERGQYAGGGFAEIGLDRGIDRQDRVLVLDEIAEV